MALWNRTNTKITEQSDTGGSGGVRKPAAKKKIRSATDEELKAFWQKAVYLANQAAAEKEAADSYEKIRAASSEKTTTTSTDNDDRTLWIGMQKVYDQLSPTPKKEQLPASARITDLENARVASNNPGLTSRWSLGNDDGISIDQWAQFTGGNTDTTQNEEAFKEWQTGYEAFKDAQKKLASVAGKDYNALSDKMYQLEQQVRDETDPERRASAQADLDWLKKYTQTNTPEGVQSSIIDLEYQKSVIDSNYSGLNAKNAAMDASPEAGTPVDTDTQQGVIDESSAAYKDYDALVSEYESDMQTAADLEQKAQEIAYSYDPDDQALVESYKDQITALDDKWAQYGNNAEDLYILRDRYKDVSETASSDTSPTSYAQNWEAAQVGGDYDNSIANEYKHWMDVQDIDVQIQAAQDLKYTLEWGDKAEEVQSNPDYKEFKDNLAASVAAGGTERLRMFDLGQMIDNNTSASLYSKYATPDEFATYEYIYDKDGEDDAEAYREYLDTQISQRRTADNATQQIWLATNYPAAALVIAPLTNIASQYEYPAYVIKSVLKDITGDDVPIDVDASFKYTNATSTLRGTVSQNATEWSGTLPENIPIVGGKGLGDAVQLGNSIVDAAIARAAFGKNAAALFVMPAAAQSTQDALDRGASRSQAILYGGAQGGVEWLTENVSVGTFFDIIDSNSPLSAKGIIKQMVAEGSEEATADLLDLGIDALIMGDKSQLQGMIDANVESGEYADYDSAEKAAWKEFGSNTAYDFLGGVISGGANIGVAGASGKIGDAFKSSYAASQAGKAIQDSGNMDALNNALAAIDAATAEVGADLKKYTNDSAKPRAAGKKYAQVMSDSENLYGGSVNAENATAIQAEYDRQLADAFTAAQNAKEGTGQSVQSAAQEAASAPKSRFPGMDVSENPEASVDTATNEQPAASKTKTPNMRGASTADETSASVETAAKEQPAAPKADPVISGALRKIALGEKVTKAERAAIQNDATASRLVSELDAAKAGGQVAEWIQKINRTGSDKIRGLVEKIKGMPYGKQEATADESKAAEAATSPAEAIKRAADGITAVTAADGTAEAVKPRGITTVGEDASAAKVTVEKPDGTTEEVSLTDVSFGSDAEADKYGYASTMATPELANTYRVSLTADQDAGEVAKAIKIAYEMGTDGVPVSYTNKSILLSALTDMQRQDAYNIGANERAAQTAASEAAAAAKRALVVPKTNALDYGTVDVDSLDASVKAQVDIVQVIADNSGFDIELFESQANDSGKYASENGSVDFSNGRIRIDTNAGRNYKADEVAQTAILSTLSHELTHEGMLLAPKEYQTYRAMVLDYIALKTDLDIDALVDETIARDSSVKTRDAALDEVVANASSTMLRDSSYVEQLVKQNPANAKSIGQKILDFIAKMRDAIRKAFAGNKLPKEARALLEYMSDLAKPWEDMMLKASGASRQVSESKQESKPKTARKPAGTVGEFDEPAMPENAHIDQRTWESVSDSNVNAFENDYRYSRGYMGAAAKVLWYDAQASQKGAKFFDDASGTITGQKRQTTEELAYLMDKGGWTWARLSDALKKLADAYDSGDLESVLPNSLIVKRVELSLDRILTEGYTTTDGVKISPDKGYVEYKRGLPGADTASSVARNAEYGSFDAFLNGDVSDSGKSSSEVDSTGNPLTQAQSDFFADSKARDADGNLLVLYHGTNNAFYEFRPSRGQGWGTGIYLSNDKNLSSAFGNRLIEAYANLVNPFDFRTMKITDIADEIRGTKGYQDFYEGVTVEDSDIAQNADVERMLHSFTQYLNSALREVGYDGIIADEEANKDKTTKGFEVIAFSPEQVKETTNRNPTGSADIRYSVRDLSEETDSEGWQLSSAQAEFFKDSAFRDGRGKLIPLFHQTNADFTVFDIGRNGAGYADNEMPSGVYMKESPTVLKLGANYEASKQMQLYARVTNPLVFDDRATAKAYWMRSVKGYKEMTAELAGVDQKYGAEYEKADALIDEDEDRWDAETARVLAEWKNRETEISREMKSLVDQYLADSQYDGILLRADQGTGGTVRTYIALHAEQVKSTTNRTPTSSPDIRYSARERDAAYLSTVESGDMGAAQRMVDEAAKAAGYTIKAYHGSSAQFTTFDRKRAKSSGLYGRGFYFTDNESAASVYGNPYAAYLKIRNPLSPSRSTITRAQTRKFLEAVANNEDYSIENYGSTDVGKVLATVYSNDAFKVIQDVNATAIGDMVEAVRLFNEVNGTLYDGIIVPTETVVFDPSQIKSSDPVTYSPSGSVIPLSERFNPANEDIRYSVREVDSEGNELSEGQKEFFKDSKVRDTNGKLLVMYHGTPHGGFTVFNSASGAFFSTDKEYARLYTRGNDYSDSDAQIYAAYLNSKKPFDTRKPKERRIFMREFYMKRGNGTPLSEFGLPDWTDGDDLIEFIRDSGYDYDSVAISESNGGMYEEASYAVLSPSQIKNIDNRTPSSSPDIRYSARDPESISNREILATAFESVAQNERERGMLFDYKGQIDKYNAIQSDLSAKRARIKELTFGKYERTADTKDELVRLKNQAKILADQLSRQDKKLLTFEAAEPLQNVLKRERVVVERAVRDEMNAKIKTIREQRDAKVEQTQQAARERVTRLREGRKETEIRAKIKKVIADLNDRLLKPREGRFVPKDFTRLVVELGEMVQTRSNEPTSQKAKDKLNAISKAYEKLKGDPNFGSVYNDAVRGLIDEVSETVGDKTIYQLGIGDLTALYKALKAAQKMVSDAAKVFGDQRNRDARQLGLQGLEELRNSRGKFKWDKAEKFFSSQLSARSMFLRFGNHEEGGAWDTVYRIMNEGEHNVVRITMEANAIFKNLIEGAANQKRIAKLQSTNAADLVDVGLMDVEGNAVKITRGMMLELYMDLQNDQNVKHIMYGGMKAPDLKMYYDGKPEAWGSRKVRIAGFGARFAEIERRLGEATTDDERAAIQDEYNNVKAAGDAYIETMRSTIANMMTPYENKLHDAMDYFYNVFSKETLNEATETLFGFSKATVEKYFPIRTDKNFRSAQFETIAHDFAISSAGIMKTRVNSAMPILLGDIIETTRVHIKQMSQYAGLIVPISDFSKIYNTTLPGYRDSLRNALETTFDVSGTKWVDNFMSDVNGARRRETTAFDVIKGKYAKAILTANLSSALKQVTAYPTAASVVGWGPTLKALARGGRSETPISRADRTLIDKYSTVLYSASRGLTSVELGDVRENMKWGSRFNKAIDFLQKLDVATRGRMWDAARYYVNENFPGLKKGTQSEINAGGSEYYKKVAEVFDKIVEDTQQSYSATQLPDILRSPNALIRSMTMFMSQPLKNLGVVYDAGANLRAKSIAARTDKSAEARTDLSKARTQFANVISAQVAALIFEKIMSLAAMALLYKVNPLRDDDDDITWESVLKWLGWDTFDSVLGSFTFGSELASLIQSIAQGKQPYDIDVGGVSSINDFVQNMYSAVNEIKKMSGDEYEWPTNFTEAATKWGNGSLAKIASSIGNLAGVPVGNVLNILKAGYFHAVDAANGALGSFDAGVTVTKTDRYEAMYQKALAGDSTGFSASLEEMAGRYDVAVSDVRSSVKGQVGDAFKAGTITYDQAFTILRDYIQEGKKEAAGTLGEWQYTIDAGESYGDLKDRYLSGAVTFDEAVQTRVTYGLVEQGDAETAVNKWRYELETGTPYEDIQYLMLEGDVTEADARAALMEYGGLEKEKAAETTNGWVYMDATGADSFTRYSYVYDTLDAGGTVSAFNSTVKDMMTDYGMSKDAIIKATRTHINSLVGSGEITPEKALSMRKKYLGETFDVNSEYFELRELRYVAKNGSSEGYGKYKDFVSSAKTGGAKMQTYADELISHGVEKGTIAGQIAGEYKAQYLALKESNPDAADAMLEWLLDAYVAIGYDRGYEQRYIAKNWKLDED